MTENNLQPQIDEEIDKKLAQEEVWEESYGHLFREKKEDRMKQTGGTLAGQSERIKANKGYGRGKGKPKIIVKIRKK